MNTKSQKGAVTIILALIMAVLFAMIILTSTKLFLHEKERSRSTSPSARALQKAEEALQCAMANMKTAPLATSIFENKAACEEYKDSLEFYHKEGGNVWKIYPGNPPKKCMPNYVNYIKAFGQVDDPITGSQKRREVVSEVKIRLNQSANQLEKNCQKLKKDGILPPGKEDDWERFRSCELRCVKEQDPSKSIANGDLDPCAYFKPNLGPNSLNLIDPVKCPIENMTADDLTVNKECFGAEWCPTVGIGDISSNANDPADGDPGSMCWCISQAKHRDKVMINKKYKGFCSICRRIKDPNYNKNPCAKPDGTGSICENIPHNEKTLHIWATNGTIPKESYTIEERGILDLSDPTAPDYNDHFEQACMCDDFYKDHIKDCNDVHYNPDSFGGN